jgi:hypothetical protein
VPKCVELHRPSVPPPDEDWTVTAQLSVQGQQIGKLNRGVAGQASTR